MSNTLLSALVTKLDNKIAASKTNGFFSTAQKEASLNTAGERVCNYRAWKALEDSKKTTTVADQEYYDEPDEFQADSIYAMKIDGEKYDKKDWMDFQDYVDNESSDKVFATHDGLYFINPIPDESNLELCIYGIKKWVALASADASILPAKFDEAIVMLAFAECLDKKKEYSAAAVIRKQVEEPANPEVQGSGGLLARIGEREDDGGKSGSCGKATSTRFLM
jgi:hypothetical protein